MKKEHYALCIAILTPDGRLFSDIHFGVDYIGSYRIAKKAFEKYVSELHDVYVNENNPDAEVVCSARCVNPQSGMVEVYTVQRVYIGN